MNLCVIPARGGSKRIPRKNIKNFCGKPMIAWSIEAAIKSNCFDRIIVSTDDIEIASISKKYGAEVPFLRPAKLSDDYVVTATVMAHAIKEEIKNYHTPIEVCCIYATAPFLESNDLKQGLEILKGNDVEFVFSATRYAFPIQRAFHITPKQKVKMFQPKYLDIRSQDLKEAWHDAAQFYWGHTAAWLDCKPMFSENSMPIVLPRYRVQDIDTLEDWEHAELIFRALHSVSY
jgi:pseudaminic acid cytidylyltransferase